jgi:hypothetical protein
VQGLTRAPVGGEIRAVNPNLAPSSPSTPSNPGLPAGMRDGLEKQFPISNPQKRKMTNPAASSARRFSPEKALTILGILYGIAGGLALLAGLFYVVGGVLSGGYFAGSIIAIGGILLLGGALWCAVWRLLRKRRGRVFCLVNGVLVLPLFPIGTALGIYTLILLTRREVMDLFISTGESRADQE